MTEPAFRLSSPTSRALPARQLSPRPNSPRALPEPAGAQAAAHEAPTALAPWAPAHGRTAPSGGASLTVVQPRAVARPAARGRRPVHVVVALGMTAGLYAVSLAGVTALQAAADTRVAADRAPAIDAVARLRESQDALESRLTQLDDAYATAADRYKSVAAGITEHEKALNALGEQVNSAAGSASKLSVPSARLPGVSGTTSYVSKPTVNACTTASGKPC
jgi:hypothetical protein